jgi:hypothetical protein
MPMYLREKKSGKYCYLQIVEGYRDQGRVRQRVLVTLGRVDQLQESGQLAGLVTSAGRFCEKVAVLEEHKKGEAPAGDVVKIGPGLLFGRLWEETHIGSCLRELLIGRRFKFDAERAAFLTAVHRLVDPGSDREADKWRRDHALPGVLDDLELHHLYRTMAWLGEELPDSEQEGRTPFVPRCLKDLVEERLFEKRRHLFTTLVVAFFDTTSIHFEGQGGESLGKKGHSKSHRPDLNQIVVGLILDGEGNPICTEVWPGNTSDVTTLLPVMARLRQRFQIRHITIVADRGMISKATIEALEQMEDVYYILGARMRAQAEVRDEVLARPGRYHVVHPPREKSTDPSPLEVKEVMVEGRRYVVCYNEEQARKDRADREAILSKLKETLRQGDKAFVGNEGFRKFLKTKGAGFEVNEEKFAAEERMDGKWVLRTNTELATPEVALTYKQLWIVESLFRSLKSLLETRPIYHKYDATIRGHVFCSFLAIVMMKELQNRILNRGWVVEWADLIRDVDNLTETTIITADRKRATIRSAVTGASGKAFQAAGIALPPTLRIAAQ